MSQRQLARRRTPRKDDLGGSRARAQLGLPVGATEEEVRTSRDRVLAYLDEAPPEIRDWADRRAHDLTDRPSAARRRRPPVALVVLVLLPLVVWGVYKLGEKPAADEPRPSFSASQEGMAAPPDPAQVAELEKRVEADPDDVEAMSELGTLHLASGDLTQAGHWQQRILADHPDDIDARLALGVVLFNQGDLEGAEGQWTRAAELDPTKAEPHYNLGFLHLSTDPPDMDRVEEHWDKVIELAPDSDLADTIANHLANVGADPIEPPAGDEAPKP